MNGLPGFVADASLRPTMFEYQAAAIHLASPGTVSSARIAHRETYGCGMDWMINSWCCRFWTPGGDIVVCCPREGGACTLHPGRFSATAMEL